jgi:hypothetical protein
VNELQQVIHEKSKEANRLRDSFNTIRTTHDDLRKQVSSLLLNNQGCDTPPPSLYLVGYIHTIPSGKF